MFLGLACFAKGEGRVQSATWASIAPYQSATCSIPALHPLYTCSLYAPLGSSISDGVDEASIGGDIKSDGESLVVKDSIWKESIKTVSLTRNGIELSEPIINLGSEDKLVIRFDDLSEQPENYRYRIRHCDANWRLDGLDPFEYIDGFEEGAIDNWQFSFTTLQNYIYYYQTIPAQYTTFQASGNYALEIFVQDDPEDVILTWRFRVVENLFDIQTAISRPIVNIGGTTTHQEIDVSLHNKSSYSIADPSHYLRVDIQQNRRTDQIHTIPYSGYSDGDYTFRWNPENVFAGGNTFRYFDVSNIRTPMYNIQKIERFGDRFYAFIRPDEDRSNKVYSYHPALFGGMKVNVWDRTDVNIEADYVWVNFSLPMPYPYMNGNIYIVGALTQWQLNDNSRLEWLPQYKTYTKRMLLKQGYYAYQYVFVPVGEKEGLTATLEGDHIETPNQYNIYVYLRQPTDRYDRLVGATQTTFEW